MFKTIKSRLIAVSMIFLALSIILPVQITSQVYLKQIQHRNEEESVSKFSHTANQINEILSSSITSANLLHNEDEVYNYLISGYKSKDNLQKTLDRISLLDTIKSYLNSNRDLYAVLFFQEDGTMCGASLDWNFFMEEEIHPFYNEIQNVTNIGYNTAWMSAFPKKTFTRASSSDYLLSNDIMVCGVRKITYVLLPGTHKEIYMVVLVKEESIRNCFKYITDADSNVFLLDSAGTLISGNKYQFGVKPDYYKKLNLDAQYGSFSYTSDDGIEYQIVYYQIYNSGWILIKQTPISIQYESIKTLSNISLIIGAAFIIIAGMLYSIWAIRFTKPLNQITQALTQVHEGNLSVQTPETSDIVEINQMQQQFNQMVKSINDSLVQIEIDEQEKMILEVRNLQAQINPHFIYNSITSIRWMATLSGADKVSDMLVVLSDLLHPIFSEWTLEWTLEDELGFSENYIKLMRLRYGNRVSMKIQKEIGSSSSESIKIPRFILQPLLENSCEHGLKRDQSLLIVINIYYNLDSFIVHVTDNGAGFSTEAIDWYNEKFADSSYKEEVNTQGESKSRGIGLINVNKRLKMYYGEEYGLTIINQPNGGSCIEVRLGIKE
jgi:two-component system sensor histidine kinase YesM